MEKSTGGAVKNQCLYAPGLGTKHIASGGCHTGSRAAADNGGAGFLCTHLLVDRDDIGCAVDIQFDFLTFNFVDVNVVVSTVYLEFEIFHGV